MSGCLQGNQLQNFQFESLEVKLCEFVRGPRVSDWAKFAVQIAKDEAPMHAIANIRAFVYFHASIVCPSSNFENSQCLSNSTKLQTKDIAGSSEQQRKWGYKSRENPVPICISRDASMERVVTGQSGVTQ